MFFIRLNLVVIVALASLISTVVGPPQVDPAFLQMLAAYRNNLRRYNTEDTCRDKPWDVEDGCPWPFNDAVAKQNCRNALNAFLSLTNEEKDRICPRAYLAKCRKCGKVRYGCTFKCHPTQREIATAALSLQPPPLRPKCKHLTNIVAQING